MWSIKFADGSYEHETAELFWDNLPCGKKILELQVFNEHVPTLCQRLNGYDAYYYTKEAVATMHSTEPTVLSEIFGGINKTRDTVDEIRMGHNGIVTRRTFPLKDWKYAPSILREGKL